MAGIDVEVLLAGGYVTLLILAAGGLDLLARHAHNRSERFRTAGFRYDAEHDHWVCPEDEVLWPREYDREMRLIRYRAKASACGACRVRHLCTDSDDGREVVRPLDPWPHSEAGRFHRGIALMLVILAAAITVAELVRHRHVADLALLGALLAGCAGAGWWLTGHLRATPANFPEPSPSHGLRLADEPAGRRRTRWGSSYRSSR